MSDVQELTTQSEAKKVVHAECPVWGHRPSRSELRETFKNLRDAAAWYDAHVRETARNAEPPYAPGHIWLAVFDLASVGVPKPITVGIDVAFCEAVLDAIGGCRVCGTGIAFDDLER